MTIRIDGTNTTANPGMTGGDADTGLVFGTDEVKVVTGGTDRVTVGSTGNLSIAAGNLVLASGSGIDFSATADGSGTVTSELLDDYEEGTYTPTIDGWTGTYGIQKGTYTKIGRHVTIQGQVRTNANTGTFSVSFPSISIPFAGGNNVDPGNDIAGLWVLSGGATSTLTSSNSLGAGPFDGPGFGATKMFPNQFRNENDVGNFSVSNLNPASNVEFRYTMHYNI
jgi:hypothetical protein